ncbi:hypothetical protein K461DRAFT_313043 [Myriangium duriaei CBS 260.36]|uniref:Uncharacterized protein n=1 Tax=Myriangium duriaei CBS 260.36 TaxID=1168546 RepID=A0A9P4J2M6_9PEZI|nr:hypothetical protein K461DRAFT_313043 [Myriangium duriaei CBS 260.36]
MQTVWSRAAQVRASCRCASCTTKTSVTRHSATTASKRPTKYLTTSTLLYSGIFAVAATTDALVKEHRRQRWDDAIANAKEGVEQVQTRLEGLEGTRIFEEAESYQRRSENLESFLDEEDAAYEEPHRIPRGQTWPESSGNDFEQGNFAPQSAWASPQYQARWKARAWTPKKIHLTELAIDKLTLRILLQLDKQDLQDVVLDSFSEDFRRLISRPRRKLESLLGLVNRRIRETKAIDPKEDETAFAEIPGVITRYRQDINSHYLDTAAAVEKSVMRTFNRHSAGHLSNTQLVLDTLHSLVTSSAPPSLGTFNQMIEGFSKKLLDPSITQNVINAMRGCSTRINETTLISILEHYIRTNHYARFCYHVELMQGMHGGLSLARPDIWITEKSQERLVPTVHIRNNNKIIVQKPVANPVVFSTLIQGVLHFEGFDAALDMCQSMGRDGWGLSMKGLTPLLREHQAAATELAVGSAGANIGGRGDPVRS